MFFENVKQERNIVSRSYSKLSDFRRNRKSITAYRVHGIRTEYEFGYISEIENH